MLSFSGGAAGIGTLPGRRCKSKGRKVMKRRTIARWVLGLLLGSGMWAGGETLYVDINGTNYAAPFSSWERATPDIQFAVDASSDGDTVLVNSGTYHLAVPVTVTNAITVQSAHGANSVVVNGGGSTGCFDLSFSACHLVGLTIVNGNAADGGGAYCFGSSTTIDSCIFSNNVASGYADGSGSWVPGKGGGMYGGTARNCKFVGNSAGSGGGVYGGVALNCKFVANSSGMGNSSAQGCAISGNTGNGMTDCAATNCTVTCNSGTGVSGSTVHNCISWYNKEGNLLDSSASYCCSPDVASGVDGNITNAPGLATSSHLSSGSPCIGAGDIATVPGTDIDAESWGNPPSIGCDEYSAGSGGEIDLYIAPVEKMAAGASATIRSSVLGKCSLFTLDTGDGTTVSNQLELSHAWNSSGTYPLVLTAYNADHPAGVSTVRNVEVVGAEQYVSPSGDDYNGGWSAGYPKKTIQASVDASGFGGTVWVAEGTYSPTSTITVSKTLSIHGSGPAATIVDGGNRLSCFAVGNAKACAISGFTIRNGHSVFSGGGISCAADTVVSNCFFVANSAGGSGGGLSGGRAANCAFALNQAQEDGGGMAGGQADHCTFTHNSANRGGGVSGGATNCIAYGNTAATSSNLYVSTASHCCSPEATNAVNGNITNAPLLATSSHLAAGSPCIGAGTASSGYDIDGEAWAAPSSIGCDEFQAGTGGLIALYLLPPDRPVKGEPASVQCAVYGAASLFTLDFGDGTVVSNQFQATHAWAESGSHSLALTAYNTDHPAGVSNVWNIEVLDQVIHVAPDGSDADDGLDWGHAKQTIRSAVGAAQDGYVVLLTNGTYHPAQEIVITNSITVQGLDGADAVFVAGDNHHRCFNLGGSASTLRGLTIRNGKTQSGYPNGGGIFCSNTVPRVNGCTFSGNNAEGNGGGMYGGTASNCVFASDSASWYGGGQYGGVALDCLFTNNTARYGGAKCSGTATNCLMAANSASDEGGGLNNVTATRCIVVNNHSDTHGAGIARGTANSCLIANNVSKSSSGALYAGTANNCTIVGNSALLSSGGVESGTIRNCIVWYNTAAGSENNVGNSYLYSTCSPDADNNNGNITNEPSLFTSTHLAGDSPCRGAGNASYVSGTDIDGETWNNPPSMGCDEFNANTGGSLLPLVTAPPNAALNAEIPLQVLVVGAADQFTLDFGDGSAVTDQLRNVSHTWNTTGEYAVVLSAYNADFPGGVATTQLVLVGKASRHVSTTGNDASDGLSWATAKRTIQSAVDDTPFGGTVLVADGTYQPPDEIEVYRQISVKGTNGAAAAVVVDGGGSHRCFNLGGEYCLLAGLTIANGYHHYGGVGGGIYCASRAPVVSNCVFSGNSAPGGVGGAMERGTAVACSFTNNTAFNGGALEDGLAEHCIFDGNAGDGGGGMYKGTAKNCLFINNSGGWGGAMEWATAYNCTFVSNSATAFGSAIMYSTAYNSIFWENYQRVDVDYSGAYNCRADNVLDGVNGNTTNAPLFVDCANGNYRLLAGSPCIDSGDNSHVFLSSDLEGLPRIVGGTVDMGVYEYQAGAGGADSDGDGLPDFWESLYFGNPTNASASGNPDTDPFSNLTEYISDTDPTDSNDWFRIVAFSNSPESTVYFDSSAARRYTLLGCTNLTGSAWLPVPGAELRPGTGGTDAMQDTNLPPKGPFYKMEVELP